MKNILSVRMAGFVTILAFVAAPAVTRAQTASQTRGQELSKLQDAYNLLKIADKDYHGHRAKAMRAVEAACKDLNGAADDKRRGREAQSTSDEQLGQAKAILESVKDMATSGDQPEFAKHVSKALKEIHTALEVK